MINILQITYLSEFHWMKKNIFDCNFTDVGSAGSSWKYVSIGLDNGLALKLFLASWQLWKWKILLIILKHHLQILFLPIRASFGVFTMKNWRFSWWIVHMWIFISDSSSVYLVHICIDEMAVLEEKVIPLRHCSYFKLESYVDRLPCSPLCCHLTCSHQLFIWTYHIEFSLWQKVGYVKISLS